MAVTGESDGDHRTRDEIRRQVRMFLGAGFIAAAVPAFVITWQFLDRRIFKRSVYGGRDPASPENDSPTAI